MRVGRFYILEFSVDIHSISRVSFKKNKKTKIIIVRIHRIIFFLYPQGFTNAHSFSLHAYTIVQVRMYFKGE